MEKRFDELMKHCEKLEAKVGCLYEELGKSNARVKQLQEVVAGRSKDSTNSSKPPSSDIVKPSKPEPEDGAAKRQRGGQVGLKPQQRKAFAGTLLADYYSAYHHYLKTHPLADAQFCLAHLIRDVKFLEKLPDPADRQFGTELLAELKALFRLWHTRGEPRDDAAQKSFRAALLAQGKRLQSVALEQAPDLEPTNNAEQAIRRLWRAAF
ncbi:IS66 family transposase [Anatilimnocola floriformis]|uniref:IS66 family transposase n=1 Tax=Anatilimnocola floriformis TaxID=2948575 RepID=UPI0020C5AF9F|nr:transposase [Anatilimnocola floriformis]